MDGKQIGGKFWENFEIFRWKFYRKIVFFIFIFYFFENLLLKIEPSEITPFLQGGGFPPSPWLRHCSHGRVGSTPARNRKIVVEKWCYFQELYKLTKCMQDGIESWKNSPLSVEIFVLCKLKDFLKKSYLHWILAPTRKSLRLGF